MYPIHVEVLEAALTQADRDDWTFRLADVVHSLPHLNPATVRTHVGSRCCVNAPANHQSRHRYFRAVRRGVYRIEPRFRRRARPPSRHGGWQDRVLAAVEGGVDPTLIVESLRLTPTERLEHMRAAAESLGAMQPR